MEWQQNKHPCEMCDNARLSDSQGLTDETDASYYKIGTSAKEYSIMFGAGGGKPPRILFEVWNDKTSRWDTIGIYSPQYCPNCGRKIDEYENIKE